ncbi:MAG: hypothetical protein KAR03_12390 [Candidatus Thorarchaeota archaeon]|nr:hypothetical protein [Candidatus Thorarchaeota archaeon]
MPTDYDLGTLTVVGHDVDKLTQALGITDDRFDALVNLARKAWEHEDTISESIEYIADNSNGSELVLTLVFFGRIWEDSQDEEEEEEEITLP